MQIHLVRPICLCVLLASAVIARGAGLPSNQPPSVGDPNAYGAPADLTAPEGTPAPAAPAPTPAPAPAPAPDPTPAPAQDAAPAAPAPVTITAYQNYDFVPGDTILFADDFTDTQDGEFPDQWSLIAGQAIVNKVSGRPALLLTDGNYARVSPRVKTKTYLGPQYTIEYDTFMSPDGGYAPAVFLESPGGPEGSVNVSDSDVEFANGADGDQAVHLSAQLPEALGGPGYRGVWHHVAIAVKGKQLKVYVDQFRVLVVPDTQASYSSIQLAGIGDQKTPLIYTNIRVAAGGSMYMIGQKFTEAKIVTHGINFDVDKATLRPESMGTLNQIKAILAANPGLKFEIDGHTDNSGADAVKVQLVSMGVDATLLTTKGFGDTKPIAPNDTPEGKANNRRVEFVRIVK